MAAQQFKACVFQRKRYRRLGRMLDGGEEPMERKRGC